MTDCPRAQAQFNDFLDGTLTAAQSVALMAHLRECQDCDREFQALKATQTLLHSAILPEGEEARDRVLARFRHTVGKETIPEPIRRTWWRNPLPVGLTTAAVALLVALAVLPYSNPDNIPIPTGPDTVPGVKSLSLPSASEVDNMTALHAAQSVNLLDGDVGLHREALADANSRLLLTSEETE